VVEAVHDLLGAARRRDERWVAALARWLARWLARAAVVAAVAAVMLVPQLLYWKIVYGDWFAVPQGAKYTRFGSPMMLELLYSARNGWFSTTPIAYAAVVGLFLVPKRARLLAAGLLATVALQVYLNSTILDWWGSAAFGQRRMCNVTLPLVVGLAALLWRAGRLARRLPVWARHAIAWAILGPLVAWNLMRVGALRGGVSAPDAVLPACCDRVPRALRGGFAWLYGWIGDPFELPASAWFAWRHGVPIDRWDRAVGNYPLVPGLDTLLDDSLWAQRGVWRIGGGIDPYLVSGWSGAVRGSQPMRWTTAPVATVLVPNLMPYGQRLTLWLAPAGAHHVTVRWNGAVVAEAELAGWTAVRFELPDIALHTNELAIEAAPGPFAPVSGPAPGGPVGVAVGDLEVELLRPGPGR